MNYELFEKLIYSPSVAGKDGNIFELIKEYMSLYCDKVESDKLSNIYCTKTGKDTSKTVIIDAHLDCVGFVVSKVYDEGFLGFEPIGGIDSRVLPATEVVVFGEESYAGVITSKPPHLIENGEEQTEIKDLLIDTGINDGQIKKLINIGDVITYKPRFDIINKSVSATYLDNKAGVSAIMEVFEKLKDVTLDYNLCGVFTTGEELGLKGAYYNSKDANLAVVVDATHGQTYDEKRDITFKCGSGTAFGVGPNIDKYYLDKLIKVAENKNIPYQTEVLEGSSGTNAWAYQTLNKGIPCVLLSFPLKYMHTPVETMNISDYDNLVNHICEFLKELKTEEIKTCELTDIGD